MSPFTTFLLLVTITINATYATNKPKVPSSSSFFVPLKKDPPPTAKPVKTTKSKFPDFHPQNKSKSSSFYVSVRVVPDSKAPQKPSQQDLASPTDQDSEYPLVRSISTNYGSGPSNLFSTPDRPRHGLPDNGNNASDIASLASSADNIGTSVNHA